MTRQDWLGVGVVDGAFLGASFEGWRTGYLPGHYALLCAALLCWIVVGYATAGQRGE